MNKIINRSAFRVEVKSYGVKKKLTADERR